MFPDTNNDYDYFRQCVSVQGRLRPPDYACFVSSSTLSPLLVSKQIYAEAFHIFYATHFFVFTSTNDLYQFLRRIGLTRRLQITKLFFLWRGGCAEEAFTLLKTCQKLETVQFVVPCSRPPGYAALCEVRGLQKAEAKALVHYGMPFFVHDQDKCKDNYLCHCHCQGPHTPRSNLRELEEAMMRPRLSQPKPNSEEAADFLNDGRESSRTSAQRRLDEIKG